MIFSNCPMSIDLPEFTQFVQLMNWQNDSCKFFVKNCAIDLIKNNLYIDRTHMKNLGHVVPLIRFSLHCTVHIGQELITRSTPFVIHFVMMPNQLSDVGLTGWSIYCKGHLHGIRLTHNNKKNPLYLVIHSAMANIFTLWCFKLGWDNSVFIPITI